MVLVADKNTARVLQPTEKHILDHICKMQPSRFKRFVRLVGLRRNAETKQEASEIEEVLAEMLFVGPKGYTASKLDSDDSSKGHESLKKHREYVGSQIRKYRQALKMSQEALSQKAGLPQSHVCRLETGKHAPTYLTIEKLATALGVAASQLDPGFND